MLDVQLPLSVACNVVPTSLHDLVATCGSALVVVPAAPPCVLCLRGRSFPTPDCAAGVRAALLCRLALASFWAGTLPCLAAASAGGRVGPVWVEALSRAARVLRVDLCTGQAWGGARWCCILPAVALCACCLLAGCFLCMCLLPSPAPCLAVGHCHEMLLHKSAAGCQHPQCNSCQLANKPQGRGRLFICWLQCHPRTTKHAANHLCHNVAPSLTRTYNLW